jgi:hypothetical protein
MCEDLARTMLASLMCTLGKILAPILRVRVIIVEPFGVTDFITIKLLMAGYVQHFKLP